MWLQNVRPHALAVCVVIGSPFRRMQFQQFMCWNACHRFQWFRFKLSSCISQSPQSAAISSSAVTGCILAKEWMYVFFCMAPAHVTTNSIAQGWSAKSTDGMIYLPLPRLVSNKPENKSSVGSAHGDKKSEGDTRFCAALTLHLMISRTIRVFSGRALEKTMHNAYTIIFTSHLVRLHIAEVCT